MTRPATSQMPRRSHVASGRPTICARQMAAPAIGTHGTPGVRKGRDLADKEKDQDTVDLLTGIIVEFEKNAWFLRASLEG